MRYINAHLAGVPGGQLLTHNERLASKLDEIARQLAEVTSKRRKTDDDHAEMARLEFFGGIYTTTDGLIGLPSWNVYRSFHDGAKQHRLGASVQRALIPMTDVVVIQHDGPSKPADAWEARCCDQRSVKVSGKVTRTRPAFTNWSVTVQFALDTEILNYNDLKMVAETAGRLIGIGDYRPRFGRYDVELSDSSEL